MSYSVCCAHLELTRSSDVLILSWCTTASLKKARIIKAVVIIVTVIVTHLTMIYIYKKMDGIKEEVVYKRRKARCVRHSLYVSHRLLMFRFASFVDLHFYWPRHSTS